MNGTLTRDESDNKETNKTKNDVLKALKYFEILKIGSMLMNK